MPNKPITALDRIKQAAFRRLVAQYDKEMQDLGIDPSMHMGINPPPPSELDGISRYDGTAGFDNRPDFVRADDEEWSATHGST